MASSKELQIRSVLSSVIQNGNQENCFSFIVERLSPEDKDRFGDTLLRKLVQPDDANAFTIEDDTVQQLLGYRLKHHFVNFFKKHLKEDEYQTILNHKRPNDDNPTENRGGHNLNKYMFSLSKVRDLSMLAETEAGKAARQYYLKLEDLIMAYGLGEMERMQKRVDELEFKLRPARLLNQEQGDHVYVFKDSHATKVGKTSSMNQRCRAFKTMNPDGSMNHKISCLNASVLEKTSHHILDQYRTERNTEWFNCTDGLALEAVNASEAFLDSLTGYANGIVDFRLAERIRDLMKEYHEFLQTDPGKYSLRNTHPLHIAHIRTGTRPTQPGLSRSLYGAGATVFRPAEVTTADDIISFQELRAAANEPLDFDKFLQDCFVFEHDAEVISGQVTSVHKFWSSAGSNRTHQQALVADFDGRFQTGKSVFDATINGAFKVYYGLRLKRIVYDTTVTNEFDEFVAEHFIVDCSARVSLTRAHDVYQRWKTARQEALPKPASIWKEDLEAYLRSKFLYDNNVWLGDGGQQCGFLGLGLPNELVGVGLRARQQSKNGGKSIILRHVHDGDLVRAFVSQAAAAKFVGRSQPLITQRLKDGKPINTSSGPTYTVHKWDSLTEEEKARVKGANEHVEGSQT